MRNRNGDFSNAILDTQEAIRLSPDSATAYKTRGYTRQQLGDHASAIEDFTKAISLDPGYVDAYFDRAIRHIDSEIWKRPFLT